MFQCAASIGELVGSENNGYKPKVGKDKVEYHKIAWESGKEKGGKEECDCQYSLEDVSVSSLMGSGAGEELRAYNDFLIDNVRALVVV